MRETRRLTVVEPMPVKVDCGRSLSKLSAYVDGELPSSDRLELEGHLPTCLNCVARVRDLRAGSALVRAEMEMLTSQADFSGFATQVMARLDPERVPFWEQWRVRLPELLMYRRGALISLAAAAAILVAALPWMLRSNSGEGYAGQRMALQSVSTDPDAHVAPVIMQGDRGNSIIWLVSHHHDSELAEIPDQAGQLQPEAGTTPKINQARPRGGDL